MKEWFKAAGIRAIKTVAQTALLQSERQSHWVM